MIEKEIKNIKELLQKKPKETVSLRGMGKPLVSEKELDDAIVEVEKVLFGAKDVPH